MMTMSQGSSPFAPTPEHGAALRRVLMAIGPMEVANCSTQERFDEIKRKLEAIRTWSLSADAFANKANIAALYQWALDKVRADAHARLRVFQNAEAVAKAMADVPAPPEEACQ